MIILTIKQLKRRVVQGLVEPELFYMPFGSKKGTLVISILTYSAFNIDTNTVVDNGKYVDVESSIVVKNSQDEIVYNGKGTVSHHYTIKDLPYGTYSIKVIYSKEKLDNKWHTVFLNKPAVSKKIFLQWFPIYKCECYIKKEEQTQSIFNNSQIIGKGRSYFKIIEDDNIMIDEPMYDEATHLVRFWDGDDYNYVLEYTSSVITPNSISSFCGFDKVPDGSIGIFDDDVYEYELYNTIIDRKWERYFAVEIENKGYRKNILAHPYSVTHDNCPFTDEFICRPVYNPEVYGLTEPVKSLFQSAEDCVYYKYMYTDYYHTLDYDREYNGDKYWFLNNHIVVKYKKSDTKDDLEIAYSANQYKYLLANYDIIDTMVIHKNTHLPYVEDPDIILNSKLYKYYVDFNRRKEDEGYVRNFTTYLNGKQFTIISDVFSSNDFIYYRHMYSMDSSIKLSDESNDSIWFGIQAITCPNYSDDYDEYKKDGENE